MSQWVQHISGQGEKWEVIADYDDRGDFAVKSKEPSTFAGTHFLPKSEYRLCPAPERWEDVTHGVHLIHCKTALKIDDWHTAYLPEGYRWSSSMHGELRIERKVQE